MGLFNSDLSNEERKRQEIKELLDKFNIEGVECEVILPEKQLRISGSSGTKKGVATLVFGVIGWAATSGTSQNEENRIVNAIFQIVDNGIVFKNASIDGSDLRISYNEIIKMEIISNGRVGIITLLKNKKIFIDTNSWRNEAIFNHASKIINEHACGAQYEEIGWGLEHETVKPQETNPENNSLMDELERLGNMYKEGLLTDDEFEEMKKKLIEND